MVVIDEEFSENEDEDSLRGIKDWDLLNSALELPKATFDKKELYPDILDKASCYMRSIARNHAFQNANKRTALLSTITFLEQNGYEVTATNEKMYKLVETVVTQKLELSSIKRRLKKFTKEVPRQRIPTWIEFLDSLFNKVKNNRKRN